MRIAVLAVGYADGIPHRLSNRGKVIVSGHYANILGAVSMDVTTIDVTHCPNLRMGDAVTILGSEGEAKIDAQVAGLGSGYLASWFAGPYLRDGTLISKRVAETKPVGGVVIAWKSGNRGRALTWWRDRLRDAKAPK